LCATLSPITTLRSSFGFAGYPRQRRSIVAAELMLDGTLTAGRDLGYA
jgi:hypothetical protein